MTNNPRPTSKEEYEQYKSIDILREIGDDFSRLSWPSDTEYKKPSVVIYDYVNKDRGDTLKAKYIDVNKAN